MKVNHSFIVLVNVKGFNVGHIAYGKDSEDGREGSDFVRKIL